MIAAGRRLVRLLVAASALVLGGCAGIVIPDQHAGEAVLRDRSHRVGILVKLPERPNVNEADPLRGGGVPGLLQAAIVTAVTSGLTAHAKALPMDDLRVLEQDLAQALQRRGVQTQVIDPLRMKDYKGDAFESQGGSHHPRDMRPLRGQLGVDRLLSITIADLGFNYPFSGFIPVPSGDPMAWVAGEAYLLDLRSNAFLWYRKLRTLRGIGKDWDHPPAYKALTAKYFEALEVTKEELLADLLREP